MSAQSQSNVLVPIERTRRAVRAKSTSLTRRAGVPPSDDDGVTQAEGRDSYAVTAIADITDRSLHATMARFTAGLSPAALAHAYLDWATHLAYSPGKRMQLLDKGTRKAVRFANYLWRHGLEGRSTGCCIEPLPQDKRFLGEA